MIILSLRICILNLRLTGRGLTSLNKLLLKPWFKLKIKLCLLMTVVLEIGIILHAIHVTDKWAGKNDIQKVSLKDKLGSRQEEIYS